MYKLKGTAKLVWATIGTTNEDGYGFIHVWLLRWNKALLWHACMNVVIKIMDDYPVKAKYLATWRRNRTGRQ